MAMSVDTDIIEIENFIPVDYQRHLLQTMTSLEFPWVFNQNMVSGDDWAVGNAQNHAGFNHFFFEQGKYTSQWFNLFYPLVLSITSYQNIKFDRLVRMRANLTLPNSAAIEDYHMPHIDSFFPHWNAIYYVNDSDGDTVIFNETNDNYSSGQDDILRIQKENFTIKRRVTPKQGKILLFPGKYYHSSSIARTSKFRCVININLDKVL
jgi:hypothetical protein